jgi:hypothetical protein
MYQYKDGPNTGLSSGPTGQTIYSGDTTTSCGDGRRHKHHTIGETAANTFVA